MTKNKKSATELVQSAFTIFTEGKADEALIICKKLLQKNTRDVNALNLTAIIKDKQGHKEEAIQFFKKASLQNPKNADIITNIGITYFELNNLDSAKKYFEKALKLNPQTINATFNLANIALKEEDDEKAILFYEKTISLKPNHIQSYNNLGLIYRKKNNLDKAENSYRSALCIAPNFAEALIGLTLVLFDLEKTDESLQYANKVIAIQPENEEILLHLGQIHISNKELEKAKPFILKVISLNQKVITPPPLGKKNLSKAQIIGNAGKQYLENGETEEAIHFLKASLNVNPSSKDMINTLALTYRETREYDKAKDMLEQALKIDPDYIYSLNNMGNMLIELHDFKNAKHYLDRAYKLNNEFIDSKLNCCILALLTQKYEAGWGFYRSRKSVELNETDYSPNALPNPIKNKKILIIRDQGLGDEIFFLRFIEKIKSLGPHITYVTDPRLTPIIKALKIVDTLLESIPDKAEYDINFSIGDLAYLTNHKTTQDTPPPLDLNLAIDPDQTAKVIAALSDFGPPPYIGLTWRAGRMISKKRLDAYMKAIDVELIAEIAKKTPGTIIAIQKDVPHSEMEYLSAQLGRPILDASVYHNDLPKMLTLLNILDKYITVSNTNVHLREGLSKKSHVLVCSPPEWRWLVEGKKTHWFPNSTIYRQTADKSWNTAVEELTQDLAQDLTSE